MSTFTGTLSQWGRSRRSARRRCLRSLACPTYTACTRSGRSARVERVAGALESPFPQGGRCPGGLCAWLSGVSVATCARGLNNAIMDPTMPFWTQPICGRGDRLQTTTEFSAVRSRISELTRQAIYDNKHCCTSRLSGVVTWPGSSRAYATSSGRPMCCSGDEEAVANTGPALLLGVHVGLRLLNLVLQNGTELA